MEKKIQRRSRLKKSIRRKIKGTAERPRLSVFRSNSQIYAQIIDDTQGKTLVATSSIKIADKMTKTQKATVVGTTIADMAKNQGILKVVFDRNGYLYHGRVQALAEAARKEGLNF